MPLFVVLIIIVGVVALAVLLVWVTYRIEQKQKQVDTVAAWWHNSFWSIVNSINWNDDEHDLR